MISEEQWRILGNCPDCACAVYGMDGRVKFTCRCIRCGKEGEMTDQEFQFDLITRMTDGETKRQGLRLLIRDMTEKQLRVFAMGIVLSQKSVEQALEVAVGC